MSIPLDKLIDFNKNDFELCNAVSAQARRIFQKNKQAYQAELEESEEVFPRAAVKLTSEAFEEVLLGRVTYKRADEDA